MTEARITLEPITYGVRAVRHFVHQWLRTTTGADEDRVFLVMLLTTELVSNAILHAGTELSVTISKVANRIRVEVQDGDPRIPRKSDRGIDATGGRGLVLVDRLASNWGSEPYVDGKVVWFEL